MAALLAVAGDFDVLRGLKPIQIGFRSVRKEDQDERLVEARLAKRWQVVPPFVTATVLEQFLFQLWWKYDSWFVGDRL